jgi:hypothetical protein
MPDEMTETAAPVAEPTETPAAEPAAADAPPPEATADDPVKRAEKAAFARARQYKRDLESRYAADRRALDEERAQLQASTAAERQVIARLRAGEIEALQELGVDADALVQYLTAAATQTPEQRTMARELRELREREQAREAAERERQQAHLTSQARAKLYEQVSTAVAQDTDPRLVRLRAANPAGAEEFARAVTARAEREIAAGKRVRLADVAESVWADARKTYDLARHAFADDEPPTVTAGKPATGKSPPKPGGGKTGAKPVDLSKLTKDQQIAAVLAMSDAELDELARG